MLPHEVIVTDVVYPTVLLAHEKSIFLILAMATGIQIGLRALAKSLCQVQADYGFRGEARSEDSQP